MNTNSIIMCTIWSILIIVLEVHFELKLTCYWTQTVNENKSLACVAHMIKLL
jgi:hypothetical protein